MGADRAEQYRRQAVEAERRAVTAANADHRKEYLRLAEGWRKLAAETEDGGDGREQESRGQGPAMPA
jgi:hypothetical protein